jgi:hypothetical protein
MFRFGESPLCSDCPHALQYINIKCPYTIHAFIWGLGSKNGWSEIWPQSLHLSMHGHVRCQEPMHALQGGNLASKWALLPINPEGNAQQVWHDRLYAVIWYQLLCTAIKYSQSSQRLMSRTHTRIYFSMFYRILLATLSVMDACARHMQWVYCLCRENKINSLGKRNTVCWPEDNIFRDH